MPSKPKKKKEGAYERKKRRAERGRVPEMGKIPENHVFFSQKLPSEAKKVVKKKGGRKEGSKKSALKTKKKKRAHQKKNGRQKGGRNRAPSFLVNLLLNKILFWKGKRKWLFRGSL